MAWRDVARRTRPACRIGVAMIAIAAARSWIRLVITLIGLIVLAGTANAQIPAASRATVPYRRIFFFQDEAARLVPPDYRAVTSSELESLLQRPAGIAPPGEDQPLLKGAEYWASFDAGTLHSEFSRFEIAYQDDAPGDLVLGNVNLALVESELPGDLQPPYLYTASEGTLRAAVARDCEITFAWTLQQTSSEEGTSRFVMEVPPCGSAPIYLDLPRDSRLAFTNGVPVELMGPPSDASNDAMESARRWYRIEAGGLHQVILDIGQTSSSGEGVVVPIRQQSTAFRIAPAGVRWTTQMTIERLEGRLMPALNVGPTRITSVRIDGQPVEWQELRRTKDAPETRIQITAPRVLDERLRSVTTNVAITGTAPVVAGSTMELPYPHWEDSYVAMMMPNAQTQLTVDRNLTLVRLELPDDWSSESVELSDDGDVSYLLSGPSHSQGRPQIELLPTAPTLTGEAALQLNAAASQLEADWKAQIEMGELGPQPLRLRIEPQWRVDSIVLPASSRVVEVPGEIGQRRTLTIWPEPADLEGNRLRLSVAGHRPHSSLPRSGQRGVPQIPATWFVRVLDCRVDTVAAINPPTGWRWPGESIIRSQVVSVDELTETKQSLLDKLTAKTLLFSLPEDATAMMRLERPLPLVEADVTLTLARDGAFVSETLAVNLSTPGDAITQVRIRTGPAHGRPPLSWSLVGSSTQTGPLASLDEGSNRDQDDETWVIAPPDNRAGEVGLVGRRRYRIETSQRIDLPTVAQAVTQQTAMGIAANQETSVLIGRNLHVSETTGPVQRVPAAERDGSGWHRLRYDPSEPTSLVMASLDDSPAPSLIWDERVRVHASARWGETIVAEYQTDGGRPLRIEFDPAMTLEEASTNGRPFVLSEIRSESGSLLVPPATEKQKLRLQFRRPVAEGGLLRRWTPPLIHPQGIVLRSGWSLHPVADTIVPDWSRGWINGDVEQPLAFATAPILPGLELASASESVWLIANEGFWALGTAIALLVFSLAWLTARRRIVALLPPLACAGGLTVWWPATALGMTGFVMLPIIAGGLLELAHRRLVAVQENGSKSIRQESGSASTSATVRTSVLLACLGVAASPSTLRGQNTPAMSPASPSVAADEAELDDGETGFQKTSAAFPVLIPVDDERQPAGSTVYIPEAMYDTLFLRSNAEDQSTGLQFRQADYRVRLGGSGIGLDVPSIRIDARLTIQSDRAGRSIQLPFSAGIVRSTEITVDGESRVIRWLPSGNGISLMLPRAGLNQLRVGLAPEAMVDANEIWSMDLAIPGVMRSQLTLDSDASLQMIEASPRHGALEADPAAGRLLADLGNVKTLGLRWRFRQEVDLETISPLIRRWLVHVGAVQVVTECEIDLSSLLLSSAEQVELDLYDERPVRATSRDWQIVSQELLDTMRRRLVVRPTEYPPGPIRLMWEDEVEDLEQAADSVSHLITPPNVRPVRAVPLGPSFIAVDVDPRFQVTVAANGAAEVENDRFLKGWTPGVDLIDRAYVTQQGPPHFTVQRIAATPWRADERQHLHVSFDSVRAEGQLTLDYRAQVFPGDDAAGPMRLMLPPGMQVEELKVDAQAVSSTHRRTKDYLELSLPVQSRQDGFQLEVEAWMPLPSNRRFRPPRAVLAPLDSVTGFYLMTRGSNLEIQERMPTGLPPSEVTVSNATLLSEGIVPRWSWQCDRDSLPSQPTLPGQFEVTPNPTEFKATQITDVFWQDGRWLMESVFDIRPVQGRIDFLAVELPTRWSEDPDISPAVSWSIQPGAEPSKRLIRILPQDPTSGRQLIRIRSRLRSSDSGQVSVPDVRLLGNGPRRRLIGMPPRLTNDPIRWETNGARKISRPKIFQDTQGIDENQLIYEVSGNWFAKLVAVMATRRQASASVMDVQLFPQEEESTLAICRWDLLPADRSEVAIRMPKGATALGVWSAGMPAPTSQEKDRLRVPLHLSRLAQSVELLVRLAPDPTAANLAIPQLVEIPVDTTWFARFDREVKGMDMDVAGRVTQRPLSAGNDSQPTSSEDQAAISGWQSRRPETRGLALGKSIVEVLEGSLDSLAQRPNDEIAAWLLPWLNRADRVLPDGVEPVETESNASAEAAESAADMSANHRDPESDAARRVAALRERLDEFTSGVLGTTDVSPYRTATGRYGFSMASKDRHPGFVAVHPGQAESIPVPFLHAPQPWNEWRLERLTVLLGLAACGLVFWKFNSSLTQLANLPAFWLFLVGLVGLLLAPLPVAIAICIVALLAPWLPTARGSRHR